MIKGKRFFSICITIVMVLSMCFSTYGQEVLGKEVTNSSKTVDFSDTLTVEEFTIQLLKAMGEEDAMEYAYKQGYIRPYLNAEAPYYSTVNSEGGIGNYKRRLLFFYNSDPIERNNKEILPEDMIENEVIKEIKQNKIVMQSEFITHKSLMYYSERTLLRGTLRFIFYPPTDTKYLKTKGLEIGKWYEVDVEADMQIYSQSGPEKYQDRWVSSGLVFPCVEFLSKYRPLKRY